MTTDLPIRQIYNFGFAPQMDGSPYQLLQASYTDALYAGYWAGLAPACPRTDGKEIDTDPFAHVLQKRGTETATAGIVRFATPKDDYRAYPIFRVAHDQFVTLVTQVAIANGNPAPTPATPVAGIAMNWAADPFGGGANFWNVGVDVS